MDSNSPKFLGFSLKQAEFVSFVSRLVVAASPSSEITASHTRLSTCVLVDFLLQHIVAFQSSNALQSNLNTFSNSKQRSGKALQTLADKEEMKFGSL